MPDLGEVLLAGREARLLAAPGHRHQDEQDEDDDEHQGHEQVRGGRAAVGQLPDRMAQFLTTMSESPEPTLPAASVARTISRCTPGFRSGSGQGDLLAEGVEQAVVGEERRPGAAVEGVVGLHQAGQAVGQHDQGLLLARGHGDLGRLVIDDERTGSPGRGPAPRRGCSTAGRWRSASPGRSPRGRPSCPRRTSSP